jgi:hypothetical protein
MHGTMNLKFGIINSTTRSHLVGYFYKIYIMMNGSMNIKYSKQFMYLPQNLLSRCCFAMD